MVWRVRVKRKKKLLVYELSDWASGLVSCFLSSRRLPGRQQAFLSRLLSLQPTPTFLGGGGVEGTWQQLQGYNNTIDAGWMDRDTAVRGGTKSWIDWWNNGCKER